MDAEKIILTKNFYELSPAEKEAIKDYAQNETDFNEIKSFLQATQQTFNQQKLQVSTALNDSILHYLHQPVEQKKTWFNRILLFLFPKNKSFYQYPAFQLGLASILLLFIINVMTNKNISNANLAVNDKKNNQPLIIKNESIDEIPLNQQKEKQYIDTSNFLPPTIPNKTELKSVDEPLDFDRVNKEELYLEEVTEVNEAEDIPQNTTDTEAPIAVIQDANSNIAELEAMETEEKTKKTNGGIFSKKETNTYSVNRAKTIKTKISIKNTSELIDLFFISK